MSARYIVGDTRDVLASMPDQSVDLVLSSPPFLALRSYLPADHVDKAKEIGSEATPGAFLDVLLDVVEECARVLTPHGSLVFELGDTYSGSGGAGGDYGEQGLRDGQPKFDGSGRRNRPADVAAGILAPTKRPGPEGRDSIRGWPLAKSLTLIPQTFAWALAYGRNPWTGRETERWRVRNIVAWCRPNPPVGSLGDKFRPATSYLTVACKARDRWFDLDSVREPPQHPDATHSPGETGRQPGNTERYQGSTLINNPAGVPPLDWWEIPTQPYKNQHYATWPEKLLVRPIKAMCPTQVCTTCGEPRRRIVGEAEYVQTRTGGAPPIMDFRDGERGDQVIGHGVRAPQNLPTGDNGVTRVAPTLGWSDCGHNTWRRGTTLDPFAGSGTTLAVAEGLARDSIGIDLDARNAELAYARCGMFLSVETHNTEHVA